MNDITTLIDNEISLKKDGKYCGIIGLNPSLGARSPDLWRRAFKACLIDADFHAFDVQPENLTNFIDALKSDTRFLGGACAIPYKEQLPDLLNVLEPEAAAIGAVNALYRNSAGQLVGGNTDGAAAFKCLEEIYGSLEGKNILVLGLGGTGKAVATFMASAKSNLTMWNRTHSTAKDFSARLSNFGFSAQTIENLSEVDYENTDIVINCTSVGFSSDGSPTTASPIELNYLQRLPKNSLVFDIIYLPEKTEILKSATSHGLATLNGLGMNKEQAVIAFCKNFPKKGGEIIRAAMA